MSAFPIEWHEECLKNSKAFLEKEERYLVEHIKRVERMRERQNFGALQLSEAKKLKKKSYDSERFMIARNK